MSSLLDSIDAVLFDIGSTLIMGPPISPVKEVVNRFHLTSDLAEKVNRLMMCTNFENAADVCDMLRLSGIQLTQDDSHFIGRLWQDQQSGAVPIPGALDSIRFFKTAGKAIGLLSDIWPPYYRAFTSVCPEIDAAAAVRQLSFRAGIKKPDPTAFRAALRALESAPARTLMVGDTYENDIAPAIGLGMKTAWILSRAEREVPALAGVIQGRRRRPDLTIASIAELQSAVIEEQLSAYQNT